MTYLDDELDAAIHELSAAGYSTAATAAYYLDGTCSGEQLAAAVQRWQRAKLNQQKALRAVLEDAVHGPIEDSKARHPSNGRPS